MRSAIQFVISKLRTSRFDDPALEEEFHLEKRDTDVRHSLIAMSVLLAALVLGTAITLVIAALDHAPLARPWWVIRLGLILPIAVVQLWALSTEWGRRHFRAVLVSSVFILVGLFSLEWVIEWSPTMTPRALWVVPGLAYMAVAGLLPLTKGGARIATIGALGMPALGELFLFPRFGWITFLASLAAYGVFFVLMGIHVGWLEETNRELFLRRREIRLLGAQLTGKNEELIRLIKQRDEFVAGMLHDLRTPVTAILLAADSVGFAQTSPEDVADVVDTVKRSARRIESYTERFLEQRSLERAAAAPSVLAVGLEGVVGRAIENARISAAAKQQRIMLDFQVPECTVRADELLLDRALGNLLSNAVKYSPFGSAITVRIHGSDGT